MQCRWIKDGNGKFGVGGMLGNGGTRERRKMFGNKALKLFNDDFEAFLNEFKV